MGGWSRTFEAATAYLSEISEGSPPSRSRLLELIDRLTNSYHQVPASEPDDAEYDVPLRTDWPEILNGRFPDFDCYPFVFLPADFPCEAMLGDPIDDLADIALDLEEYLWRLNNVSEADANWHVRFTFEIHWGRHARDLGAYLQATAFTEA